MSTKHTLGPWHTKAGLTQMCDDDATTVARGRPHGNDGAFWWIFSPAETHGDAEADARLIAEAPELLESLTDLMSSRSLLEEAALRPFQAHQWSERDCLLRDLREQLTRAEERAGAAIARAKGEPA